MVKLTHVINQNMNELVSVFIITNVLIIGFYKIFQIQWPELYFAVNDQVSYFVSISPLRYILFRLLPPFIITAIIVGSLNNSLNGSQIATFATLICLSHSLLSNGRAIYNLIFNPIKVKVYFNKYLQIIIHLFTIVALGAVGYIAGYLSSKGIFLSITPSIPGLVDNIWSTIIVAFASVLLYEVYSSKTQTDIDRMLIKSHKNISEELTAKIHKECQKNDANERLVLAVCITENLQRPHWVRKLEKLKSRVNKQGSYGIMQISSDHYISDEESIEKAVKYYFAKSKFEYMDSDTIEKWVMKYNKSNTYAELVKASYYYLPSDEYDEVLPG